MVIARLALFLHIEMSVIDIILIIVGIAMVLWGAEMLTSGSVALARRMNVPQIVIGLTIVAIGTSMPEFCVSMVSALKGSADLAVGNVVGSNIFNELLIVGIAAIVAPMVIAKRTVGRDIPFAIIASLALWGVAANGDITRMDAGILLLLFFMFMALTLHEAKKGDNEVGDVAEKPMKTWKMIILIIFGLVFLIIGSDIFVDSATAIARGIGVSDAVIGLTIVAGGTSLPELATSIVSARKGASALAIGNVLGSNVFNILGIIGITGLISPMRIAGITYIDYIVMSIGMVLVWLFSFTKYTIHRWEGVILTAAYVGYIMILINNL